MPINAKEREILRELAKRQAEIAALPVMAERKALWYDLNDGKTEHPLVTMEFHGLEHEVYPAQICEDPLARAVERQMSHYIFKHENFKDDRVIPASVSVQVQNSFTSFGARPDVIRAGKADGSDSLAYVYKHPVRDLEEDIDVFGKSTFKVDEGLRITNELVAQVRDAIGDIIPVRPEFSTMSFSPASTLLPYMGMETMFTSILDYPDLFHRVVRRLTDDYHAYLDAIEAAGAMVLNNDASRVTQDSYGYTHDLPGAGYPGRPLKISDLWGYGNSQETVGMSDAMYDEFFFSYAKEISDRYGLVSYGCCEPVHAIWERCLSRMKNLRKLSVSPWCDQRGLAEMIRGTKICFHRKPSPNFISVDSVFDEAAFLNHMKETVRAAAGCPLEITFRDITSVRGEPQRLTRAVELTREAFATCWKP